MKYAIDMGHCVSGPDYGVVGLRPESELTREVGRPVITKLQLLGHEVINVSVDKASSVNDSLYTRYYRANQAKADMLVSIHFNATPGGAGTEIYTFRGTQLPEATRIRQEFKSLGLKDRGTKDGSHLAMLKRTTMKSMLVECCFCDNPNDMRLYNSEKFADAIVKGLTGKSSGTVREIVKSQTHYLITQLYSEMSRQGFSSLPLCKQGARGNITKTIQQMLLNIGYPVGSYGADGCFGQGTSIAIKAFQRDCNLSADGIVGQDTWKALFRNLK